MAKSQTAVTGTKAPRAPRPPKAAEAVVKKPKNTMEDFVAQQLAVPEVTTQAAPEPIPEPATFGGMEDTPEFKEAIARKIAEMMKQGQISAKKPKLAKNVKNDVTAPGENTLCGRVWAAADAISIKVGGPAPIALLKAAMHGVNSHTVKTQYSRWRKFHGIEGRVDVPQEYLANQIKALEAQVAELTPDEPEAAPL